MSPARPPSKSRRVPEKNLPRNTSRDPKNEILKAALKVFAKHSFEGASLQEIADLAKIGQPLLHYHFGSKESLWKAAVDYALDEMKRFFETVEITTVDLEPIDVVRVLCRSFITFSSRYPEHALILINEMRVPGRRFHWLLEKYLRPIHRRFDLLLEEAQRRNEIKKIPVVHLTNTIFITLVHFFTIGPMLHALYETDPFEPDTISEHAKYTLQILFEGMTVPRRADQS